MISLPAKRVSSWPLWWTDTPMARCPSNDKRSTRVSAARRNMGAALEVAVRLEAPCGSVVLFVDERVGGSEHERFVLFGRHGGHLFCTNKEIRRRDHSAKNTTVSLTKRAPDIRGRRRVRAGTGESASWADDGDSPMALSSVDEAKHQRTQDEPKYRSQTPRAPRWRRA